MPSVAGVLIEIPALSGSDMNSVLCPVRALRIYMRRTSFFRRNRKRLFISYIKAYDKEICASTISMKETSESVMVAYTHKYTKF